MGPIPARARPPDGLAGRGGAHDRGQVVMVGSTVALSSSRAWRPSGRSARWDRRRRCWLRAWQAARSVPPGPPAPWPGGPAGPAAGRCRPAAARPPACAGRPVGGHDARPGPAPGARHGHAACATHRSATCTGPRGAAARPCRPCPAARTQPARAACRRPRTGAAAAAEPVPQGQAGAPQRQSALGPARRSSSCLVGSSLALCSSISARQASHERLTQRAAMHLLPAWQTIPFLAIWVSLTAIYGFRLWRLQPTILTLAAVTLATGGVIGVQVASGREDGEYLAEVPLIALMFLVMVWHGRRRLAAMDERLAAMAELQRVSEENLRLLEQQHRFLQDASHELGTPITVALGHAELIERAAADPVIVADARVVADELGRLRRLASRMLLLASAGGPDFLHLAPVEVEPLMVDTLGRWGRTPRRWTLGAVDEATVLGDHDRLALALDALLENAVSHTDVDDRIEVTARLEDGSVVLAVVDEGCGIPAADLGRIFDRFARVDPHRNRQ